VEAEFAAPLVRSTRGKGRDKANPFAEHQLFCEKGIDNLEDMTTCSGTAVRFATFVYHRYPAEITDAFAGRILSN